ncbi:MAG: peptidylprolyl isomerase [Candidatus Aenigmarchaeota archaeon]|nr:peptidylprolyl isomerase [Candidatus Aenigmarchaeota archaeon]
MKKGDFVEIDFVGRIANTGEIFDLTDEETAKSEGIHDPKHKYKPSLVIIGSNMAVPGVEKNLEYMRPGEDKEFELLPEEAFGGRDMHLIRIVSMAKFIKEKISPAPGMFVDIDGMQTKILSVAGGRVRVDFNHPLAGKSLKYKVKLVRHITDTLEKSRSLLSYYGVKCDTTLHTEILTIETEKPMNEFLKKFLSENLMKWLPDIKNITFADKETEKKKEGGEATFGLQSEKSVLPTSGKQFEEAKK